MDLKKTGGHAFPTSDVQTAHAIAASAIGAIEDSAERDRVYTDVRAQALQGMTLRDFFAAKACAAIAGSLMNRETWHGWSNAEIAKEAYDIADAMLAERAK